MTSPMMTLGFQPTDQAAWRALNHEQRQEMKAFCADEILKRFPVALAARWSALDDLPVKTTDFKVDETGRLWSVYVPAKLKELSGWIRSNGTAPDYDNLVMVDDAVKLAEVAADGEECVYYTIVNGQRVCKHCWPVDEDFANDDAFQPWELKLTPKDAAAEVAARVFVEVGW